MCLTRSLQGRTGGGKKRAWAPGDGDGFRAARRQALPVSSLGFFLWVPNSCNKRSLFIITPNYVLRETRPSDIARTSWKRHLPPFPGVRLFQERGHPCRGHRAGSKVRDQDVRAGSTRLCTKAEDLFPSREGGPAGLTPTTGRARGHCCACSRPQPRGRPPPRPRGRPPPREPHTAERWPRGALWRQLAERWAGSGRHPRPHEGTRHAHSFHLRNIFLARKGGWRQLQARELITDLVQQARSTHTHKCGVIQPARSRVRLSRSNTHRDTYS